MIDHEKLGRIQSGEAFIRPPLHGLPDLSYKSIEELLDLRRAIDKALPSTSLQQMNLEEELVLQYHRAMELQAKTLSSEDIPANQQAQVTNSVASILQQLVKMQSEFHTAERFKAVENLMLKYIKKLPIEVAESFLDEYERLEEQ
jgi:hypothetical protein